MIFRGVYRVDTGLRWVEACVCLVLWHDAKQGGEERV